jgi:rRNA maturation endonuclease Nob1
MNWNKCPGCFTTSDGKSAFCPNCGEPWIIVCNQCGSNWRFWEAHKYCPTCGTEVKKKIISGTKHK